VTAPPGELSTVGNATVTGTGGVSNQTIDSTDGRQYIVNLTGVTNAQNFTVTLTNVTDVAGNVSSSLSATMAVLTGDTNADKFTDAIDVSQVKSQSGNAVTASNFREDVNVDNFIDAIDVSLVKSFSGTALGSAPAPAKAHPRRTPQPRLRPLKSTGFVTK
jgi:hypothetical protein